MSGGSMNYIYSRLQDEASFRLHTAERRAFAEHLKKVVKALHDIEWVDSCDYGPGDENEAIRACLAPNAVLHQLIEDANRAGNELAKELARATGGKTA